MANKYGILGIYILAFGSLIITSCQTTKMVGTETQNLSQIFQPTNWIDTLLNGRQFVFKAEFGQGSDMIFVLMDSTQAEVQNGNRNNLQGKVVNYEVSKTGKKGNISVKIHIRGAIYTADAYLFIGSDGRGKATIRSDFPGNFDFNGELNSFENANIYISPSHFIH